MNAPTFRGFHAIGEVLSRVRPLCQWFRDNRPECSQVRLAPADYDLIVRWPKAAALHGFEVVDGQVKLALGGGLLRPGEACRARAV